MNYKIHTNAIRDNLIPSELTARQRSFVYADEADLLNVALFGQTASEWRKKNPGKDGNMRDLLLNNFLCLPILGMLMRCTLGRGYPSWSALRN